jgi:hypothetical protein
MCEPDSVCASVLWACHSIASGIDVYGLSFIHRENPSAKSLGSLANRTGGFEKYIEWFSVFLETNLFKETYHVRNHNHRRISIIHYVRQKA